MEGKEVLVDEPFLRENESILGANGGIFNNNFVDVDSAGLHPNCHCRMKMRATL